MILLVNKHYLRLQKRSHNSQLHREDTKIHRDLFKEK